MECNFLLIQCVPGAVSMGELAGVYDAGDSKGWTLEHVELYPHPVM